MISVSVTNLTISNVGVVVLLKGGQDDRTLPIVIGPPEARAIHFRLNNVQLPRPMTHDLLKNVLDILEARLERVEIRGLNEGTFYSTLILVFEGRTLEVDSRPSDAIALALRCNTPILVAEAVMDEGGVLLGGDEKVTKAEKATGKPDDDVSPLQAQLEQAIVEERYEDAARLRDELKVESSSN